MLRDGMRDDTVGEDIIGAVTRLVCNNAAVAAETPEPESKNRGRPEVRYES